MKTVIYVVFGNIIIWLPIQIDNIIQIYNSVMWDWLYSTEYSMIFLTFNLNVVNIPHNIVSPT